MRFWNKLFENIEKIHKWGKITKIFLTNYGWILFGLILCFGFIYKICKITQIHLLLVLLKVLLALIFSEILYISFFVTDGIKKNIICPSSKSYIIFIFYFAILLFGEVQIISINGLKQLIYTNFYIFIFIEYSLGSIIWFSYFIYKNANVSKLKLILKKWTVIVTLLQLLLSKISENFSFCLAIMLFSYLYIEFLFENKEYVSLINKDK